jgi:hypothetical protein
MLPSTLARPQLLKFEPIRLQRRRVRRRPQLRRRRTSAEQRPRDVPETQRRNAGSSTGSGEPSGNAFFVATGVRLLQMPMTPAYVRGMLADAKA